jgi:hypothetical protein
MNTLQDDLIIEAAAAIDADFAARHKIGTGAFVNAGTPSLTVITEELYSGELLKFEWSGFKANASIRISVVGGGGITATSNGSGSGSGSFIDGDTPSPDTPYTLQATDGTNTANATFYILPRTLAYFIINGQSGTPGIAPGTTVSAILVITNEDTIAHDITIQATEALSGILLADNDEGQIQPLQEIQVQLLTFTMPDEDDVIIWSVNVDGEYDNGGQWNIDITNPTPLTSISIASFPVQEYANAVVPFTAVVTNISTSTITVQMKGVLNPGAEAINVPISPASFSLAPNATKTVSGSFTMLDETCFLDINSYVNGGIDDSLSESVAILKTGTPTLIITNTQIAVNGTLAFSCSGFYPSTAISIDVVENDGTVTNVAMVASDASGNIASSTTPALNFPAGSYELQATDDVGDSATATFSIIAPATVSITISPSGSGTVTYSPTTNLKSGMGITLTPTAKSGYYFSYWELPDGTTQTATPGTWVLQGGANNITAVFSQTNIPPGQQATISTPVSPVGAGTVAISSEAPYSSGEAVTLTAVPADGYYFAYWTYNGQQVTTNPIPITLVAGANTITANFTTSPSSGKGISTGVKIAIIGGSAILIIGAIALTGGKKKA